MKKLFYILIALFALNIQAQTTHNPLEQSEHVIWGQAFAENSLNRFPTSVQSDIPSDVWARSLQSSGLHIRFKTNAISITVNYSVSNKYSNNSWFSDMGANGLDLYARKPNGSWCWCYPTQRTVGQSAVYSQLAPNDSEYNKNGYEFYLYLPPFTSTTSLTITVNAGAKFSFIPVQSDKKPIVVYGTSIVQGAVCSRPANTWVNILSRELTERPVINLGFSGAGRMEEEVVQAVNRIDASLYILDCLPNMTNTDLLPQIISRYKNSVATIRQSHPNSAILLTEHPGHADMGIYDVRRKQVEDANKNLKKVYNELISEGYENIYYLSMSELGLNLSADMGDYIHPNDKGMRKYADAYLKKISEIDLDHENETSMESNTWQDGIEIYPNPSNGCFTIDTSGFPMGKSADVVVYDINGYLVYKDIITDGKNQISLLNATHGIYFLHLINAEKSIVKKVIVK